MTKDDAFKKRVRDRMSRTGESYTTARANMLVPRPGRGQASPLAGDRSDLASLIYRSNASFVTATGEGRWTYNGGIREALRRRDGEAPERPDQWEKWEPWVEAFWIRLPDQIRLERRGGSSDRTPHVRLVDKGKFWAAGSRRNGVAGVVLQGNTEDMPPSWMGFVPDLLEPTNLLSLFDLAEEGTSIVAGHPALRLRGTPRPSMHGRSRRGVTWFWTPGATSSQLWIDKERGVLLRHVVLLENDPISTIELTAIEFDVAVSDGLMPPASPVVEYANDIEDQHARREWITKRARALGMGQGSD